FQPNEEKALVNEALAYYLLGQSEKAFELITPLRARYPHSSAAAAVWVRVVPQGRVLGELESAVVGFIDKEVDVVLGIATRFLEMEDASRGEKYAKRATEIGSDAPQAWFTFAQAIHVQAMQERTAIQQNARLREAKDAYSRTIELA